MNRWSSVSDVQPKPGLKVALLRVGMSQRDLAKRASIPEAYISHYIHGRMSLKAEERARIAASLGVPVEEVFK